MKVYAIHHQYGEDGGYGDCVPIDELIAITSTAEEAIRWCKKHENPHVYEKPYAELECGYLYVEEIDVLDHLKDYDKVNWNPHTSEEGERVSLESQVIYCT